MTPALPDIDRMTDFTTGAGSSMRHSGNNHIFNRMLIQDAGKTNCQVRSSLDSYQAVNQLTIKKKLFARKTKGEEAIRSLHASYRTSTSPCSSHYGTLTYSKETQHRDAALASVGRYTSISRQPKAYGAPTMPTIRKPHPVAPSPPAAFSKTQTSAMSKDETKRSTGFSSALGAAKNISYKLNNRKFNQSVDVSTTMGNSAFDYSYNTSHLHENARITSPQ